MFTWIVWNDIGWAFSEWKYTGLARQWRRIYRLWKYTGYENRALRTHAVSPFREHCLESHVIRNKTSYLISGRNSCGIYGILVTMTRIYFYKISPNCRFTVSVPWIGDCQVSVLSQVTVKSNKHNLYLLDLSSPTILLNIIRTNE